MNPYLVYITLKNYNGYYGYYKLDWYKFTIPIDKLYIPYGYLVEVYTVSQNYISFNNIYEDIKIYDLSIYNNIYDIKISNNLTTSTDMKCGPNNKKRCKDGYCCSSSGWCGNTSEYCSNNKDGYYGPLYDGNK